MQTVKTAMLAHRETRVSFLRRENPKFLFSSIVAIIATFCKCLNVQMNLNTNQIETIARNLINDCPDWSIYDFVIFFKTAAKGGYGQFYGSVDQPKIYEMLKKYEEERSLERESLLQNEKQDHSQSGRAILENSDKLPALRELLKQKRWERQTNHEPESLRSYADRMRAKHGML